MDPYQFFSVLFFAVAKTRMGEILVAQFIGYYGAVDITIIGELPHGYESIANYQLIDYQGYQEICKLTGEKNVSVVQYIKLIEGESDGMNSIVMHQNNEYNYDQQNTIEASIEVISATKDTTIGQ